jgi:hypothetical protein
MSMGLAGSPKTIQKHIMPRNAMRNTLFYNELFCIAIYRLRDKRDFPEFLGGLLDCHWSQHSIRAEQKPAIEAGSKWTELNNH